MAAFSTRYDTLYGVHKKPDPSLIGTPVRHFGEVWIISGINYLHDFNVVRFDAQRGRWQHSSISSDTLPVTHPHHWTIPAPEMKGRFARALRNAERLHPWMNTKSKSAKAWRRARHWRGILKNFFEHIQAPRPRTHIRPDAPLPTPAQPSPTLPLSA